MSGEGHGRRVECVQGAQLREPYTRDGKVYVCAPELLRCTAQFTGLNAIFADLDRAHAQNKTSAEFWADSRRLPPSQRRYVDYLFCALPSSASVERVFSKHKLHVVRSNPANMTGKFLLQSVFTSSIEEEDKVPLLAFASKTQLQPAGTKRPRESEEEKKN